MASEPFSYEYDDWRQAALFVLRDWRDELFAVALEIVQKFRKAQPTEIVLNISAGAIVIEEMGDRESVPIARIDDLGASLQSAAPALAGLVEDLGSGRDVVLCLPACDILRPKTRLPFAKARALRGTLLFELERLSPIAPEALYFDFALGPRDKATHTVEIDLRIIKKIVVDEAIALCKAADLGVSAIRFAGDERDADWQGFPIDHYAFARSLWRRWSVLMLTGAAIFLAIALLFAAYARGAASLSSLTDQLVDDGQHAARVERLLRQIDLGERQLSLLASERQKPLLVGVLADVTRILPDNSWVQDLQRSGNRIRIQGQSESAATLPRLIDQSGWFRNAHLNAPIVKDPTDHMERFDLSFDIMGGTR